MLVLIVLNLSTRTHKKAKRIWDPFQSLIDSKFYRIDDLAAESELAK